MIENFSAINPDEFNSNIIRLIGKEWMLITAGTKNDFNTMTAAWGGVGYLWNMPIAIIYVRPQRYTYEYTEKYDNFSLSFFKEEDRKILNYCGKYSGRDVDKIKETGLKAFESLHGNILFGQAKIQIECTKVYADDIKESKFILNEIDKKVYSQKDYHRFYIGKIDHLWVNKI